jgi:hypothetical protein
MTYLVDANVLSEPTKPVPNSKVIDWMSANERNLVVDPLTPISLPLAESRVPGYHPLPSDMRCSPKSKE